MRFEMQHQSAFSPLNKYSSVNNDNYDQNSYTSSCMQCTASSNDCFKAVAGNYDNQCSASSCGPQVIDRKYHEPSVLILDDNKKSTKKIHQLISKKDTNRSTEEYKQKRERNNIAVRKSREKAKKRLRCNEARINELVGENEQLKKRIEVLSRMLNGLRLLLNTFGYTPDKINFEVSKSISQQPSTSRDF